MLESWERITAAGATAVAIVHDEEERLRRGMLRDLELPFPVAIDVGRVAYGRYGLGRASLVAAYLSPYAFRDYALRLRGAGRRMRPGRDPRRLGGDFVVAPDGTLAYVHPQAHIADRPPVGLLVREVERLASR